MQPVLQKLQRFGYLLKLAYRMLFYRMPFVFVLGIPPVWAVWSPTTRGQTGLSSVQTGAKSNCCGSNCSNLWVWRRTHTHQRKSGRLTEDAVYERLSEMGSEEVSKEEKEGAPVKKELGSKPPKPPPKPEKSDVEAGLDDRAARLLKAKKAIESGATSTSTRFGNVSSRRGTAAGRKGFVMDQSEAPSDWKFVSNEKVYEAEDTKSMGRTVIFAFIAGGCPG